jgi:hypothetical protein
MNGSARAADLTTGFLGVKGAAVSASDKAKDKAQAAKGKAKKGTGQAIDDPVLEGEGKVEGRRATSGRPARRSRTPSRSKSAHEPA